MKTLNIIALLICVLKSGCAFSQNYGYVNEQNQFVIQPKFFEAREFKDGLAAVRFTDERGWTRWRFIDETGAFVNKMKYWSVNDFEDGYTTVEYGIGFWGLIDKAGYNMISLSADYMSEVHEGMALYRKNDKVGFVNTAGKKIVKPQYTDARLFSGGFAQVEKDGKFGFINKNGEVVVPIKYSKAKDFVNNKAKVAIDNDYFELDSLGNTTKISQQEFDKTEVNTKNLASNNYNKLRPSNQLPQSTVANGQIGVQNNSNISVSSYALDLFSELGSMAIYVGSTMYVVTVKGKNLGDKETAVAKAAQIAGVQSAYKYEWFQGKNCTTLKSQFAGTFTIICGGTLDLN